jgi:hypothetical protein
LGVCRIIQGNWRFGVMRVSTTPHPPPLQIHPKCHPRLQGGAITGRLSRFIPSPSGLIVALVGPPYDPLPLYLLPSCTDKSGRRAVTQHIILTHSLTHTHSSTLTIIYLSFSQSIVHSITLSSTHPSSLITVRRCELSTAVLTVALTIPPCASDPSRPVPPIACLSRLIGDSEVRASK